MEQQQQQPFGTVHFTTPGAYIHAFSLPQQQQYHEAQLYHQTPQQYQYCYPAARARADTQRGYRNSRSTYRVTGNTPLFGMASAVAESSSFNYPVPPAPAAFVAPAAAYVTAGLGSFGAPPPTNTNTNTNTPAHAKAKKM